MSFMKRFLSLTLATVFLGALLYSGLFYWWHLRGAAPAFKAPPTDITRLLEKDAAPAAETTSTAAGFPLKLAPGFTLSVFARDLDKPRVLGLDQTGTLLASIPSQGRLVALPDRNRDGVADEVATVIAGLDRPHGFAFHPADPKRLYISEIQRVAVYDYDTQTFKATRPQKIIDLPPGGRHWTRVLLFVPATPGGTGVSPVLRLLISVGSSCDTCVEKDWRYVAVLAADEDGRNLRTFATGLRNAVFLTRHPVTGQVWATEMGRDFLGDELPPDELNIVEEGKDYGWPYCYGKGVHDRDFDSKGVKKAFCRETVPSYLDIPAHSAPLGLAFVPATPAWPKEYHHNLLVAYHGSWNRSVPTGYKVVRFKLDAQGKHLGVEDFISGWLTDQGALGRPVDILVKPDGTMYLSDDKAGVVYRLLYKYSEQF
jgi:glucose/arabinose dehydrogenase